MKIFQKREKVTLIPNSFLWKVVTRYGRVDTQTETNL